MKKLLALLILGTVLFSAVPASALEIYALAGRVVEFDYENDIVYFVDGAGLIWGFYGIEDWCIGDIVACVMSDNNTELAFDDIILTTNYVGVI